MIHPKISKTGRGFRTGLPPLFLMAAALVLGVAQGTLAFDEHSKTPAKTAQGEAKNTGSLSKGKDPEHAAKIVAAKLQLFRTQIEYQPWEVSRGLVEQIVESTSANSEEAAEVLLLAARYTARKQQHGESILFYERWLQFGVRNDLRTQVLVELGREYRELGAIKSAVDAFYAAMRTGRQQMEGTIHPAVKTALWEVAETSYILRDWGRARRLFENFADPAKESDLLIQSAFYRMGDCSRMLNQSNQAVIDFERALAHNGQHPFAPEGRLALLEIFLKREDYSLAFQNLTELVELIKKMSPAEAVYWKRRSGEKLFNHMFQQSSQEVSLQILDSLEKLDESPSWQEQISYWRGLVYICGTDWKKSKEQFLKKIDIGKNKPIKSIKGDEKKEPKETVDPASRYVDLCQWVITSEQKAVNLYLPPPEEHPEDSKKSEIPTPKNLETGK